MAKVIDESVKFPRKAKSPHIDLFNQVSDEQRWLITADEYAPSKPMSFRNSLRQWVTSKGWSVQTSLADNGDLIVKVTK